MSPSAIRSLLQEIPVVITGSGCFCAAGAAPEELWKAAVSGRGSAQWRMFGEQKFATCSAPAIEINSPDLRPVRKMDRAVQMAWLAAAQALKQSKVQQRYAQERIGVVTGTSRGPLGKLAEAFGDSTRRRWPAPLAAESTMAVLSGLLAQSFHLHGPGATLSATCASSAAAIAFAAEQILLGKADAMLVGGAEAPLHAAILGQLDSAGLLGQHVEAHKTCRPFDSTRDGLVLGEGSAFLMLESGRSAGVREIEVLAQLAGWATSVDNSGRAGLSSEGAGLFHVMQMALDHAGMTPEQIDHINTHGTGTKLNDETESRAILRLFGEHAAALPCTSTKPVTGHCLGATPALEAIICVEALRHQTVPPTANCDAPDPDCRVRVPRTPEPIKLSTVMSNSIGFWGYHASLIFAKPHSQ